MRENTLAASAALTTGDPFAPAPEPFLPARPTQTEAKFFTVIVNNSPAKRYLDSIKRESLSPTAQIIFDGCKAMKDKEIMPDSLTAELRKMSAEAETQSKCDALESAAAFVESELSELPRDGNLTKESSAARLALELNGATLFGEFPAPKRIKLLSLPELYAKPDPEFLIEKILVVGTTALFTAKEESYKSFLATDMALCVATGKPWHGFRVLRQGTVVYIAAEGASGLKRRVQAWQQYHDKEIKKERFLVLDEPLQIAKAEDRAALVAEVAALKPSLIILDTLRRCSVGLDENSAQDMGLFTDALGDLAAKTGACLLAIHHNNKTGEYSGSTALAGNVDTRLTCKRHTDDLVTLVIEKQKDFEKHGPISFEREVVEIHDTEASSLVFKRVAHKRTDPDALSGNESRLLKILAGLGEKGATIPEWQTAAIKEGVATGTFKRVRADLKAKERIETVSGAEGQRGAIYAVKAAPSEGEPDAENV